MKDFFVKTKMQQYGNAMAAKANLSVRGFPAGMAEHVGSLVISPAWTLDNITPSLFLDALDSSAVVLNSTTVSQWTDKSGNARHATQATAGSQATYLGNALSFDAASSPNYDYYNVPLALYGALFFVAKKSNANDKGWLSRDSRNSDIDGLWITNNGATALQRGASTGAITSGPVATIGQWNIVYAEANGTTRSLRVNGGAATTVASTAKIALNQIGFYHYAPPSYCFEGQIAMIVGLADTPDESLRQKIEGCIAHVMDAAMYTTRFVNTLPDGHPYKVNAPIA